MALLMMILRKIIKMKAFILFLMAGLLICAALLSSIPMYTNGSLGMLLKDRLREYQQTQYKYPGSVCIQYVPDDEEVTQAINDGGKNIRSIFNLPKVKSIYQQRHTSIDKINSYIKKNLPQNFPVGVTAGYVSYSLEPRRLTSEVVSQTNISCTLQSISDLDSHIKLTDGRLPKVRSDGVYEVLATDNALSQMNIVLGKTYVLKDYRDGGFSSIKVEPVGSFTVKSSKDAYWSYLSLDDLSGSLMIEDNVMRSDFIEKDLSQVYFAQWYYALDYQSINLGNAGTYLNVLSKTKSDLTNITSDIDMNVPSSSIISDFYDEKQQLTTMMWSLNVPVIAALCLYMFMVSSMIIEKEKNEITLLASRGAGRLQIVAGYIIEGLLLGLVALLLAPLVGYILCSMLGSTSSFMEFVDRKGMQITIGITSFAYAMLAVSVFLITLAVPAFRSGGESIVEHKRKMSRRSASPAWEKFYIDFVLLAVSGYGYYTYAQRQGTLQSTGASATEVTIDPLLFFVPVIFIIGLSLLFLRIYPYLIRLILFVGKKHYRPPMYLAMTQVSRSSVSYSFIMIFLSLTLAAGIFSANSARTINENAQEKIYYANGADMVFQENWTTDSSSSGSGSGSSSESSGSSDSSSSGIKESTQTIYNEPDYTPIQHLAGVEHTTKVFREDSVEGEYNGGTASNISLMAIEPYDFGQVVWYRSGLLPYHINNYLNLLASEPTACLISKSISKQYGIKVGSTVSIDWGGGESVLLNVYGIVDYWPSWNPNKDADSTSESKKNPMLVVANFDYIQNNTGVQPYQVWMKLKQGATSQEVYSSMTKNKIYPSMLEDSKQEIIKLRKDPFQLAINGGLTMGFLISGIVCLMGFILFWVLSLRARSLQFGVVRAIGMSSVQLKLMILWEQLMTSGAGILIGIIAGFAASSLFIPFFQMSFSSVSQVPPFRVVAYPTDLIKVFIFVGLMLLIGLSVLIHMLSKMKISNTIKMGED